jgi:DNA-binding GntR family transcriptional regulator
MEGAASVTPRTTPWGAYKGITDALRARLGAGEFATGAALPSESSLSAEYRVARNTLRRALVQLAAERLIAARPGRGWVVLGGQSADAEPVPQYRSMAADLRSMIESGKLRPGDALPSEMALADRYGVARGTARHALAELEGAGLVESVHGKGRFVLQT